MENPNAAGVFRIAAFYPAKSSFRARQPWCARHPGIPRPWRARAGTLINGRVKPQLTGAETSSASRKKASLTLRLSRGAVLTSTTSCSSGKPSARTGAAERATLHAADGYRGVAKTGVALVTSGAHQCRHRHCDCLHGLIPMVVLTGRWNARDRADAFRECDTVGTRGRASAQLPGQGCRRPGRHNQEASIWRRQAGLAPCWSTFPRT